MSSSQSVTHLYRSLLRELRFASKVPRRQRSTSISKSIRTLVESSSGQDEASMSRTLIEGRDYLRASRIHAELLKRYNPTLGMTEAERVKAAARRVGLDTPLTYKAG